MPPIDSPGTAAGFASRRPGWRRGGLEVSGARPDGEQDVRRRGRSMLAMAGHGRAGLLAVLVALVLAGGAQAGPPGKWSRVTDANGANIDEVGVARTPDGFLHVVWRARFGTLDEGVRHARVSVRGKTRGRSTVVSGLSSVANPSLVTLPDGSLQAFFGGLSDSESANGIQTATAAASGVSWSFLGKVSESRSVGDAGADAGADGAPLFAWAAGVDLLAHTGTDPGVPDLDIGPGPLCCYADPGVGVDRSNGDAYVSFYSNVRGRFGIFAQRLRPAGGHAHLAPGSRTRGQALQPLQRTPITARRGAPGVYLAYCGGYPVCKRVILWRAGSKKARKVGSGSDVENVNVAPGPDGRLWVMWEDAARKRLYAVRTNESATKAGAVVSFRPPRGTRAVWALLGEGSLGRLDVLAQVSTSPSAIATWHTQVLAGLTLACQNGNVVRCTVADAGDPVKGAKVKIGGRRLTTNGKGNVTIHLSPGRYRAVATKAGYTPSTTRVRAT